MFTSYTKYPIQVGFFCTCWTLESGGEAYYVYCDLLGLLIKFLQDTQAILYSSFSSIPVLGVYPRLHDGSPIAGNFNHRFVLDYLNEVTTTINKLSYLYCHGLVSAIVPTVFEGIWVGFPIFGTLQPGGQS